ncbi:MAG: hypothetical protein EAZ85_04575 [Bacteroidetes bacterium]|nr:MAG: hypothetical protein EAZ85_04575 [Bacteroidota bacterium]TAG85614.1 MAG: hypothetical protein EAZ20_14645 [Bacteroidota bacterium]
MYINQNGEIFVLRPRLCPTSEGVKQINLTPTTTACGTQAGANWLCKYIFFFKFQIYTKFLQQENLWIDNNYIPLTFTKPHQVLDVLQWILDEI